MNEELNAKIQKLGPLLAERFRIDEEISKIIAWPPPPQKAKPVKKVEAKTPKEPETKHRGFTEDEKNNIIQLANRGESPRAIAKLFKRTPAAISGYLWKLRKEGLVPAAGATTPSEETV